MKIKRSTNYLTAVGGTIDDTIIGGTTPEAGSFTQVKWAKGADVASANALALGIDGNYFDVTGTTSITSINTLGVGIHIGLHFDGILTLTHDATDLILPGDANITTAAGDEAWFVEYATGDWRCVNYSPAVGSARIGVNVMAAMGEAGAGLGICPPQLLPDYMIPLTGYDDPTSDNFGNYINIRCAAISCWNPRSYYKEGTGANGLDVNVTDLKGIDTYATENEANADGYALHRAFIDGGLVQAGFFFDKYKNSKVAVGAGQVASSVKDGLPLSTTSTHNPIADLTACASNYYYEAINAAHARDGVDGAVNPASIWHAASKFQYAYLAMVSKAHGQACSSTTYCAWYDVTYNYPKGCNDNALGDYDDGTIAYVSDGYSNCGKTGSGTPFAKTTHNGQICGVADLNGLMYEVSIGITCIASAVAIEAMSQANPCQITWTGHGMSTDDYVMILGIAQADWSGCKNKLWQITRIDDDNFTIAFDASGFGTPYDAGDPGTVTKCTFYVAKEATAMKDFSSGNSSATDHWGATGVAAMMDAFTPAFVSGGAFAQRMGSGANQVLDEALSGNGWLLTGLGFPKDADGVDSTGTNLFGKDYFYQYIRNELCVRSCAYWNSTSLAGVWYGRLSYFRTTSSSYVSWRGACYLE